MQLRNSNAWQALFNHAKQINSKKLQQLFADDSKRFNTLSFQFEDILLDLSKNRLTTETLDLLFDLTKERNVENVRSDMFAGKEINFTEKRAVLHTALRDQSNKTILVNGQNIIPEIQRVLQQMQQFSEGIISGTISGSKKEQFTDVVNIGIGGSDLGPKMAVKALVPYHVGPQIHFVSNVDGAHISDTLAKLNPATTLFLIASKTFTTTETMTNAQTARQWIVDNLGDKAVKSHFVAISSALNRIEEFGIESDRMFEFWDWVGGRYSIWSAIGLPLMLAIGSKNFTKFLTGGYAMDRHFIDAPLQKNLPILMGLVGVWNRNFLNYQTRAILPYDERLSRLTAYLQQLDMESNGKRITQTNEPIEVASGPIVWGEPGTNGQHAFYQLLHQGNEITPVEFLLAVNGHESELIHHHRLLVANCLAQSEALMMGRTEDETKKSLLNLGYTETEANQLSPHKSFPGNRPSTTIIYDKLDPYTLGRLVALYEHRVFVEGVIWNINSFDQWGVELGKELANNLVPVLEGTKNIPHDKDSSTKGLLNHVLTKQLK